MPAPRKWIWFRCLYCVCLYLLTYISRRLTNGGMNTILQVYTKLQHINGKKSHGRFLPSIPAPLLDCGFPPYLSLSLPPKQASFALQLSFSPPPLLCKASPSPSPSKAARAFPPKKRLLLLLLRRPSLSLLAVVKQQVEWPCGSRESDSFWKRKKKKQHPFFGVN